MRDLRLAAVVLVGCMAFLPGAGGEEDLAADVEGRWERPETVIGSTWRHVKEHKDGRTHYTVYDDEGKVFEERTSRYEVKMMGLAKMFVYSDVEFTSGPNKGTKVEGRFAYLYRVEGDRFYEAQGMLASNTGEPRLIVWKRVKGGDAP